MPLFEEPKTVARRQLFFRRPQIRSGGFTLIETVLAIGVVSFAMISILGLVPVGLGTFRKAMNLTVESSIVQSVSGDVLRTDYTNLAATNLYFDEQGVVAAGGADAKSIYTVEVAAPQSIDAANLVSAGAAGTVLVRINNRAQPTVTNSYAIIVPRVN